MNALSDLNFSSLKLSELMDLQNQLEDAIKTEKNKEWTQRVHEFEKSIKNCPEYQGEPENSECMDKFSELSYELARVFGINYNKFHGLDDLDESSESDSSIESPMRFINENMDKLDKVMIDCRTDVSVTITKILSRFFIATGLKEDQKNRFYDTFQSLLSFNKIYIRHEGMRAGTVQSYVPGYFIGKKIKWGKCPNGKPVIEILENN